MTLEWSYLRNSFPKAAHIPPILAFWRESIVLDEAPLVALADECVVRLLVPTRQYRCCLILAAFNTHLGHLHLEV